jgi:hypothetical protein
MAAWNKVLVDFKKPNNSKQQQKDVEAVSGVAEAKRGSDGSKGRKPLQTDWSRRNGPELDRRKGENRNSTDEQPCGPAEEDLRCHGERFSRLCCACVWLVCAPMLRMKPNFPISASTERDTMSSEDIRKNTRYSTMADEQRASCYTPHDATASA